jgi:hypothetical protein
MKLMQLKKKITSNKGELLAETLISMLILVVLIALVTNVIQHALIMIGNSIQRGREIQEEQVNPAVMGGYQDPAETGIITFSMPGVSASHSVFITEDGITAFSPEV